MSAPIEAEAWQILDRASERTPGDEPTRAANPCPACAKPLRPRATYCDRCGWTHDADPLAGSTWPGGAA
jgi:hypothetical protein